MTDTASLIAQLRVLAHLTRAEAQAMRLRFPQATDGDARDVVARTVADADGRAARIADALRDLGALPDPVAPVLGHVAALVRGAVTQAQPLDEALLGDLALEHLLGDRARYVAALADAADLPAVRALADDLEAAHAAHARWLHEILGDLAAGRATALDPSPSQRMAAQVARAANVPGHRAVAEPGSAAPPAPQPPAPAEPGPPKPTAPPIPGFTELPAHAAIAALRTLDDPRDVAAVLAVEQADGNRPGVVAAARVRADALRG